MGDFVKPLIGFIFWGAIFYFWYQRNNKKKADILTKLDGLGQVLGRPIDDLATVLGKPWHRGKGKNGIIDQWHIGKVSVTARWNNVDDRKIEYYMRSDKE